MKNINSKKVLGSFLMIVFLSFGVQAQSELPNVNIKDLKGAQINVADYGKNGKITILNFWATWCSPCKKELSNIMDLYPDWQEKYNAELLAVSTDDARNAAKVKSYVAGVGWEYIVLLDDNQELKRQLGFQTVPFTLIVDADGKVVYKHTGYVEGDEYELEDKLKELSGK